MDKNKLKITVGKRCSSRDYIFDFAAKYSSKFDDDIFGVGISSHKELAKTKAIFECLERFHISNPPIDLPIYTVGDLKNMKVNFIDPKILILFKDNQYNVNFPYKKFSYDLPIYWVRGVSLIDNKKIFVPAFFVYGKMFQKHKEGPFTSITSGFAAHRFQESAVEHASLEYIERDTAMISWLTKKGLEMIDLNSIKNIKIQKLCKNMENEGLRVFVFFSTFDISIPVIISLTIDKNKNIPYASFGIAAGFNLEDTILHALEENLLVRNTLEILKKEDKIILKKIQNIQNLFDHMIYYSFPENSKYYDFMLSLSPRSIDYIKNNYKFILNFKELIGFFKKKKIDLIKVDIVSELLKKEDISIVRVFSPQLQQMEVNHNCRFLKDLRIRSLNLKIVNNYPHPFG